LLQSITDYRFSVEMENGQPRPAIHDPGCLAVTGYAPEDYERESDLLVQIIHSEDRERVLDEINRVFLGQTPAPVEHRILHRNGQVRWVRFDDRAALRPEWGLDRL
jgi:PAS domain-containing protein